VTATLTVTKGGKEVFGKEFAKEKEKEFVKELEKVQLDKGGLAEKVTDNVFTGGPLGPITGPVATNITTGEITAVQPVTGRGARAFIQPHERPQVSQPITYKSR